MHRFLASAINLALNHEYDPMLGFQLCAIIYRGGAVLSVGFNGLNKNGFVNHFAREGGVGSSTAKPFINMHSEMAAICGARNRLDLRGSKIAVARVKKDGSAAMARPCPACEAALRCYGIKRCLYTIEGDEFGVMCI